MGSLRRSDRDERPNGEKYQLRKQEIFKAIKNNRALTGLEGFLLFLLFLRERRGKISSIFCGREAAKREKRRNLKKQTRLKLKTFFSKSEMRIFQGRWCGKMVLLKLLRCLLYRIKKWNFDNYHANSNFGKLETKICLDLIKY